MGTSFSKTLAAMTVLAGPLAAMTVLAGVGVAAASTAPLPAPVAVAQGGPNVSNLGPDLTMTQTSGSASLRAQPHVRAPMNQWPTRYRGAYNVAAAAGWR